MSYRSLSSGSHFALFLRYLFSKATRLTTPRVLGDSSFESLFDLFVLSIASSSNKLSDSLCLFYVDSIDLFDLV